MSSLDSASEALIQEALAKLMKGKTTIVIAHRLSTIMKMDRIVVIERGSIVDHGTHAQLLKKRGGTYKKLWEIQAGGFMRKTGLDSEACLNVPPSIDGLLSVTSSAYSIVAPVEVHAPNEMRIRFDASCFDR